jgi:hypothetical protein
MKTSATIFTKIREKIGSEEFKLKHRLSKKAFTRKCLLDFKFLVIFILNQLKKSNASEIDSTNQFLNLNKNFTKSALSKARRKFSAKAFIELNDVLVDEFYKKTCNIKRFFGFNVFAIDGSKFQLPESDELKSKFGCTSNQTDSEMNMCLVSQLVDVSTGIILHATIGPYKESERFLAGKNIELLIKKVNNLSNLFNSILLFDRGYPSILLISKLFYNKINYLMRCGRGFLKEINDFVDSGKKDGVIEINPKRLSKREREELLIECPGFDLNKKISIRIVVVILNTGEKEVLLTSLLDSKKYKLRIFKKFYFLRWGIETSYGFEKVRAEIENFSGKSQIVIEQDIHASILHINMVTALAIEAKKELDISKKNKKRKYDYDINYSIALAYMKNRFMRALLDPKIKPTAFCSEIKSLMRRNLEPKRPGRQFKHECKYPRKRYPTNTRAVI